MFCLHKCNLTPEKYSTQKNIVPRKIYTPKKDIPFSEQGPFGLCWYKKGYKGTNLPSLLSPKNPYSGLSHFFKRVENFESYQIQWFAHESST